MGTFRSSPFAPSPREIAPRWILPFQSHRYIELTPSCSSNEWLRFRFQPAQGWNLSLWHSPRFPVELKCAAWGFSLVDAQKDISLPLSQVLVLRVLARSPEWFCYCTLKNKRTQSDCRQALCQGVVMGLEIYRSSSVGVWKLSHSRELRLLIT